MVTQAKRQIILPVSNSILHREKSLYWGYVRPPAVPSRKLLLILLSSSVLTLFWIGSSKHNMKTMASPISTRPNWFFGRPKGLTELGLEADEVYKLSISNLTQYQDLLEKFLMDYFPASDTQLDDANSLINTMNSFFTQSNNVLRPITKHGRSPQDIEKFNSPIPMNLFHTATQMKMVKESAWLRTWVDVQDDPRWNVTVHDNAMADRWVRSRFDREQGGKRLTSSLGLLELKDADVEKIQKNDDTLKKSDSGIIQVWDLLAHPPVMRSDLWRYLILAVEGGVYSDVDTQQLKPFACWGEDPMGSSGLNVEGDISTRPTPSLIVGIEADVQGRWDWKEWWPRPLQVCQWTIASARGHPVLIDVLRRIVMSTLEEEEKKTSLSNLNGTRKRPSTPLAFSVVDKTGPGVFTDAVLQYLKIMYRTSWADLRQLGPNGWRYKNESAQFPNLQWGDTQVLSITGFSPGVGHMGSQPIDHPAAMVRHKFAGSWRQQEGA